METVEEIVEEEVLANLTDAGRLSLLFENVAQWLESDDDRRREAKVAADKERAKILSEIANFSAAIAAAGIESATLVREIARREDRLRELDQPSNVSGEAELTWNNDDLETWAGIFSGLYFSAEADVKRTILGHVVREVVVHKDKSGRILMDPTALLTLRKITPNFPSEIPVRFKAGCGGWI